MHLRLAHNGTGKAQRKQQTRQQALPCDAGISRHHTAAAAAALTRPSRACAAAPANRPNALRCPWTRRQIDRQTYMHLDWRPRLRAWFQGH